MLPDKIIIKQLLFKTDNSWGPLVLRLLLGGVVLAVGIMVLVHLQYGFFMNWAVDQAGEGIEFFLLWIGMAAALFISGGGRYSMNRRLSQSI